jgi:hypothetical protein
MSASHVGERRRRYCEYRVTKSSEYPVVDKLRTFTELDPETIEASSL